MLQVFTPHRYKDTLYRELWNREAERKGKKEREREETLPHSGIHTRGSSSSSYNNLFRQKNSAWVTFYGLQPAVLTHCATHCTNQCTAALFSHTYFFHISHFPFPNQASAKCISSKWGKLYEFLCQVQFEVAAAVVAPFCCMLFANALQFASNTPCPSHLPLPVCCQLLIDGSSCAAEQNPFGTRLICGQAATAPKEVAKKITGRKRGRERGWGSKQ